jgi:hypothetical protein
MTPEEEQKLVNRVVKLIKKEAIRCPEEDACNFALRLMAILQCLPMRDSYDICRQALEKLGHKPIRYAGHIVENTIEEMVIPDPVRDGKQMRLGS